MQKELNRSNSIGDSSGIMYFANTILKNGKIELDSVRQICSFVNNIRVNFNSAIAFFEYLGFIHISESLIIPTEDGQKLYAFINNGFKELFCETCLRKIITDAVIDTSALKFDLSKGKYYIQRYGFPITAAVFRNVLIQFGALTERPDGTLEIADRYELIFAKCQKGVKSKMSLDTLKKRLAQQEIQGEIAELFVFEYEKKRLIGTINATRVRHISDIDVSAGYDIASFENGEASEYNRFIEVKSYRGKLLFYWSKNEMDVASLHRERYYVYLVNMDKINEFGYAPTIIQDPVSIIVNSDEWLMQPTSYLVLPTSRQSVNCGITFLEDDQYASSNSQLMLRTSSI